MAFAGNGLPPDDITTETDSNGFIRAKNVRLVDTANADVYLFDVTSGVLTLVKQ